MNFMIEILSEPSPIIAFPCQSVSPSMLLLNFVQIVGFVKLVLLDGFVKINTWICQSCYIELQKLFRGFVRLLDYVFLFQTKPR